MEKKREIMLPTASEEAPVRNFLILMLLIPAAPFIMIYSIVTGKLQNPFVVGACLTMILGASGYYLYEKYTGDNMSEQEKLQSLFEEIGPKEKEKLQKKISTLRKSIGVNLLPPQLDPMLDIEQDMLTINYYYYLLQTGYMGKNAEGSVYVLQNALYSPSQELARAAWKSLSLINTQEAKNIKAIFTKETLESHQVQTQQQKKVVLSKKYKESEDSWTNDVKNDLINFKNRF